MIEKLFHVHSLYYDGRLHTCLPNVGRVDKDLEVMLFMTVLFSKLSVGSQSNDKGILSCTKSVLRW